MRKGMTILLCVVFSMALCVAVGGQTKKVKVNVLWLSGMNQSEVIKTMFKEDFPKKYPNIEIVLSEAPTTEIAQKAKLEAVGHTGAYDVLMQSNTIPELVAADALSPLDDLIARDKFDIKKMVNNGILYQGKYWGIPVRGDLLMLHYNAQQFKDAGLNPDKPPTSWAEFEDYAKKLTRGGKYGVSRGYGNSILMTTFANTVFSLGGRICDDNNKPIFNDAIGLQAADIIMRELKDLKVVDPAATGWNYSEEVASYLSGAGAMFIHWPARYIDANYKPEKSKIIGQSRVAPMFGKYVLLEGWYAVMFNTTKVRDAAWEVLKYLGSAELQKEVILRGGDCNPTNLDVFADKDLAAKYPVLDAYRDSFTRTRLWPQTSVTTAIKDIICRKLNMAAVGVLSNKEALDQAVAEATQALRDSGELK